VSSATYSNGSVTISTVTYTGGDGAIYWGLSTSSASTPSVEQLFNCQDGSGAALLDCDQQILVNGQVYLSSNIDWLRSPDECSWLFHIQGLLCAKKRLSVQTDQHITHHHVNLHLIISNYVGLPSNCHDSTAIGCTAHVMIHSFTNHIIQYSHLWMASMSECSQSIVNKKCPSELLLFGILLIELVHKANPSALTRLVQAFAHFSFCL
jgi:hypothetical protein